MRKAMLWLPVAAVFAGCGPNNDVGFYASGSALVTITDPSAGTAGTTTTGFQFPQHTRIDPTPVQDNSIQTTGTCQVGPTGRTVHLHRVGGDPQGLTDLTLEMPPWDTDTCHDCDHGTLQLSIGGTQFVGTEQRAQLNPQCVFTTERQGSYGMNLGIQCSALTADNNTRTVAVNAQLTLDECDGPETRNP